MTRVSFLVRTLNGINSSEGVNNSRMTNSSLALGLFHLKVWGGEG